MENRINKEIQNMMKDKDLNRNSYGIEIVNDSNTHLIGLIRGANDTPFQFGVFRIDIRIPKKYPFVPPICKFLTPVWHPNISSHTGVICLDILKDQWAAAMTLESVLKSLQAFLSSPQPSKGAVGMQYEYNRSLYDRTAKYWTYSYAIEDLIRQNWDRNEFKDFEDKIEDMDKCWKAMFDRGIDRDEAISLLSKRDWDYFGVEMGRTPYYWSLLSKLK